MDQALYLLSAIPAGGGDPLAGTEVSSVWDFVVKGGPIMVPIALCSVLALTVIAERFYTLRRSRVIPPGFFAGLRAVRHEPRRAIEYAKADGSALAGIVLRQRMRLLSALPQVSTMLGLLGTIFGMIKTFQSVAASGESLGKAERLAEGIYEAWTATAAGLLVAIPVMIFYQVLMGRIDSTLAALDKVVFDWIEEEAEEQAAPEPVRQPVRAGPSTGVAPLDGDVAMAAT